MAGPKALVPLTDIRDAIRRVERYTKDKSAATFAKDDMVRDAVERCVEIISEASRRIPAELKARHPEIPWPKIAAMGNVLRHEYNEVDAPLMWDVARHHLPSLKRAVNAMLRQLRGSSAQGK